MDVPTTPDPDPFSAGMRTPQGIVIPPKGSYAPAMLDAGEWAVAWRCDPQRFEIIEIGEPKPDWADERWVPEYSALTQDTACQALLRLFVSLGFEADRVDDAMGKRIRCWAEHPERVRQVGGKNRLMAMYTAVSAHFNGGGRLRDVPEHVLEGVFVPVFSTFGAEHWLPYLSMEKTESGPFPEPYASALGDLWTQSPGDALPRVQ